LAGNGGGMKKTILFELGLRKRGKSQDTCRVCIEPPKKGLEKKKKKKMTTNGVKVKFDCRPDYSKGRKRGSSSYGSKEPV